jgi:enoyl-CoA hydratase/carnithine racemase
MKGAVTYRSGSPVGEILISQPDRRNAISADMWADLAQAVDAANSDRCAALIVIRGEGDHFAAGADISEFAQVYETAASAEAYTRTMLSSLAQLEASPKPTLAAVRGACVGGGCSIALACDFRFADHTARFGVTPAKLGLVYSLDDTRRLVAAVGEANAKDILFTGRLLGADEAVAIGLAQRSIEKGRLDEIIALFAKEISDASGWSIAATKTMLRHLKTGAANGDSAAMQLLVQSFTGEDFREGYRAFLEKRPPKFPSR